MATRFEPRTGLDAFVAERHVAPAVDRALDRMRDLARTNAPPLDVWITARDERVRRSHVLTDGQGVPRNLRFKLPKVNTGDDINDIRAGYDLARYPGDPDLPIGNRINCRCVTTTIPDGVARTIQRTDIEVQGTRVRGEVYTHIKRGAESEFGNLPDDQPAHFMTDALRETAASMTSTRQR